MKRYSNTWYGSFFEDFKGGWVAAETALRIEKERNDAVATLKLIKSRTKCNCTNTFIADCLNCTATKTIEEIEG